MNGKVVSLSLSDFVYGTQTETFAPMTTSSSSSTAGLVAAIMAGFGAIGASFVTNGVAPSSRNESTIASFLGNMALRLSHLPC